MKTLNASKMDIVNQEIVQQTFYKLLPQHAFKNPVMACVWVGTVLTFVATLMGQASLGLGLTLSLILLITVLFANYAEAVAEAKGRGQASSLRQARENLFANRLADLNAQAVRISATELKKGDFVIVNAGELIPADGEIIQGFATINESAVTGESAPVLREANTDCSGVIGGTKVLSDSIIIEVSNEAGHSFLDRMIALVEGANRQKTPNEIALGILLNVMTVTFIVVVMTLPFIGGIVGVKISIVLLIALLVCLIPTTIGGLLPAIGIAGMNRALKANVLAKSGKAVEVAGDIDVLLLDKTGTITYGDRQATAFYPLAGVTPSELRQAAMLTSFADPTPEGKSVVSLGKELGESISEPQDAEFIQFSAATRLSGVDLATGQKIRKGAADAILKFTEQDIQDNIELKTRVEQVASKGATPLVVASNHNILGVIELSDVIKQGIKERFALLRQMGIKTIMVTGDNPLTAAAIAAEAGVDDYIAEARPEDKLACIRNEQAMGRLVAMVGDGTNDAPALAQADIGLAMNSGTQAAKEAGNMVDLDSDPTKLLDVVEIGKQQLITRGALTTFSLANDVSKYFVILPALFAVAIPQLNILNILHLDNPSSAIVSALIFNALIIPMLIPLALRGVQFKPASALQLLRRNMLVYGVGGVVFPFIVIKLIDVLISSFF
ncbi:MULTISPECIES: potassium-transporting ATPase subunit KdpB [unclassified Acinetobacter]|uniref:potassium-transporting ATPase subunit KdpB n=1 Tax=unclassified Acinetobacter TaxID=196816 RepID=UPI002449CD7E|nr:MULTISPECIES: potassium-transporting ATPase subunit KdpB [unclassified Acinetobacter]MDH0032734.1 potassium-transporting ATPase subunit KdpB [Acinetobacter sp. GD04021]MDH0885981.1 potassium-transporting ATPase subunit KdpB [Acinetobacter sp. GD03873]MDH1082601.1 potassium-transporting ATPase subunit KdpB [Acinetobacter sp. GD03983]MDH2189604.1 potassium-transporting ATPase subunit KdpB [Acinetobacter sp. GD03645]MDH2203565.1 potassium-transporting ATPase subunit KdpB [Acinetobacter sp. GD0